MRKISNVHSFVGKRAFKVGRDMALSNDCDFHLAAFLRRGKSLIRIGINQSESHARFIRIDRGNTFAFLHAEMDALIAAKPGDTLIVVRWMKDGSISMSRPCNHCQRFIAEAGIERVIYSGWNGNFWSEKFA